MRMAAEPPPKFLFFRCCTFTCRKRLARLKSGPGPLRKSEPWLRRSHRCGGPNGCRGGLSCAVSWGHLLSGLFTTSAVHPRSRAQRSILPSPIAREALLLFSPIPLVQSTSRRLTGLSSGSLPAIFRLLRLSSLTNLIGSPSYGARRKPSISSPGAVGWTCCMICGSRRPIFRPEPSSGASAAVIRS